MSSLTNHLLHRPFYCFGFLLLGIVGVRIASAGTGYVDAQGKWHLSVAFIQPDSGKPIDEEAWLKVFRTADTLLYYATNGKHQFGTLTLVPKRRYSSIIDIFIWREEDRSLADVYGLNRLGYHVYLSDCLRDPDGRSVRELAKLLIHALGHYLYSLYDEYRDRRNVILFGSAQCIHANYRDGPIDRAACFMESFDPAVSTWCFNENHEMVKANIQKTETWQSQDNKSQSCWSTMQGLYPGVWGSSEKPQMLAAMSFSKFVPFTAIQLAAHSEFVVAVDASILSNSAAKNILLRILGRALCSYPEEEGAVVLLKYNRDSTQVSAPMAWDAKLATNYKNILTTLRLSDKPNANFSTLLRSVLNAFNSLAHARSSAGGASRTFLFITSGQEKLLAPEPALMTALRAQNIRTTIGFVSSMDSLSREVVNAYDSLAARVGGTVYDATFPSVAAYEAIDAANKQAIDVKTVTISSPGTYSKFDYTVQDSIAEAIVSVTWPDPACSLAVTILRNGVGSAVTAGNSDDWGEHTLKARRYRRLAKDEKLQVLVTVPAGCGTNPLPVTFAISDEKPAVFFTVTSERSLYGVQDNQVVHARVNAPYPLVNLDSVVGERVDAYGEFLYETAQPVVDDGVDYIRTKFFHGDWIKDDGIYSQIIKNNEGAGQLGRLMIVRFLASNFGQARLASGEKFSNADRRHSIPKFRRVAFVTYFLDQARKTSQSLGLDLNPIKSLISNPSKFNVTGNLKLTPEYPHIYAIRGTINGLNIKFDGNKIDVKNLKISLPNTFNWPSLTKLQVVLTALYRTGDSVEVKLDLPVPLLKGSNGNLLKEFWRYPSYTNPFGMATYDVFDIPAPGEKPLTIDGILRQQLGMLLADQAVVPSINRP